jgi:hypothetical protein
VIELITLQKEKKKGSKYLAQTSNFLNVKDLMFVKGSVVLQTKGFVCHDIGN